MKLYMFRAVPLPIIRNYPLYIRHWHMFYKSDDSLRAWSGWNGSTSRTVPGSIPGGVTGFFSDIFLPTVTWSLGRLSP